LPPPGDDTLILKYGPPPFEEMLDKMLVNLGYNEKMIFNF